MSEGLERLKRIKGHFNPNEIKQKELFEEDFNTIEKELKEKEEILDALSKMSYQCGNLLRYKRALEILKAFDFIIEDYTEELNGSVCVSQRRIILDNEEIDSLKEVMLWD